MKTLVYIKFSLITNRIIYDKLIRSHRQYSGRQASRGQKHASPHKSIRKKNNFFKREHGNPNTFILFINKCIRIKTHR